MNTFEFPCIFKLIFFNSLPQPLISYSLYPSNPMSKDLLYFKLWILMDLIILIKNIKGFYRQASGWKDLGIGKFKFVTKKGILMFKKIKQEYLGKYIIKNWMARRGESGNVFVFSPCLKNAYTKTLKRFIFVNLRL